MNSPRCKMMMKLFLFYIVVLNMVITTAAVTTNNRILLSNVLVGTALAASVSGSYDFSYTDLALLTTAVLVLNFPRNQQPVQDSCSAPGYTDDPLLGCYRFVNANPFVTRPEAIQGCANDGGRLLLINSEAEALALGALIQNGGLSPLAAFIQGSRTSGSSLWVGDDGSPLPYIAPTITNGNLPTYNELVFQSTSPTAFKYIATVNAQQLPFYACEI